MRIESYLYVNHLSVPLKVMYGFEDARGNSIPFYYCDREELIEYLINNDYEVENFLNIIGAVQCIFNEKNDTLGLYIEDVERGFKDYFKSKGKPLFSDIKDMIKGVKK